MGAGHRERVHLRQLPGRAGLGRAGQRTTHSSHSHQREATSLGQQGSMRRKSSAAHACYPSSVPSPPAVSDSAAMAQRVDAGSRDPHLNRTTQLSPTKS